MPLKFNKSTDSDHEIKLDSSLISASWRSGKAVAGDTATFEVLTAFVGEGAPIKIVGKSESGEKLGKIKDTIRNNIYVGKFEIPEDIEEDDMVYFEVKLSKNKLEGESNRIPVFLPVRITNMKWSQEEARRGEIVTLSADVKGLKDHSEVTVTIYEFDRDGAHDKIIELPSKVKDEKVELEWEYEYHEDTDEILTQDELDEYDGTYNPPEYFFTVKAGGCEYGKKEQDSGILKFKDWLEFKLTDEDGNPLSDEKYVLHLPDGKEREGSLDADGYAKIEDVPPGKVSIEFPDLDEQEID